MHWFVLFCGLVMLALGGWALQQGEWFGWLGAILGAAGITIELFYFVRMHRENKAYRAHQAKLDARQADLVDWIARHGETLPDNLADLWGRILSDDGIECALFDQGGPLFSDRELKMRRMTLDIGSGDWVVFEHGTLVRIKNRESSKDMASLAHETMDRLAKDLNDEDEPLTELHLVPRLGAWIMIYPDHDVYAFARFAEQRDASGAEYVISDNVEFDTIGKTITHTHSTA